MSLRQQNKLKAQAAILEAASALIAERGVEDTTTRQIANAAGVSYQTLYNYFPSKGLILKELLAEEVTLWGTEVDGFIKRYDGDLFETLHSIHARGAEIVLGDRQELWQALSLSMLTFSMSKELDGQDLDVLIGVAHERYHALLSLAQGMGQLKQDADLHLIAHTLFCLNDHAMLMLMVRSSQADFVLRTLDEQARLLLGPYYQSSNAN